MSLSVLVRPSSGSFPGHLVVGSDSPQQYFGYFFDPDSLPDEFSDQSKYRDFLFDNSVPGIIADQTDLAQEWLQLTESGAAKVYERSAPKCAVALAAAVVEWGGDPLPEPGLAVEFGRYSFNPDTTDGGIDCYNCVKWGLRVASTKAPGTLPESVRQGRIKEILPFLSQITSEIGSPR
jgi:hypothetical protein